MRKLVIISDNGKNFYGPFIRTGSRGRTLNRLITSILFFGVEASFSKKEICRGAFCGMGCRKEASKTSLCAGSEEGPARGDFLVRETVFHGRAMQYGWASPSVIYLVMLSMDFLLCFYQGYGSGSELDPDSIGSVDPDPGGQK
jgi:hypothetical protein